MPIKERSPEERRLEDLRFRIRHSAAHVMASAVLELFPGAKFAVGPPTDDGFYYDFSVERPFTPEDLERIEARMREMIEQDAPFEPAELAREDAETRFAEQPFKLEIIGAIPEDEAITTYTHDSFVDLCRGPHVESTGKVAAFKLMSVAGAYWRGDERNEMLQRIYGSAWESEEKLQEHLARLEEAARRDHRKLGQELGLFFFNPIAPASPFFLPRGATLYNTLVAYVRDLYERYGYREVITPQVFDAELWKRSGHYDHYKENMYFTYVDEREFGVKPMNCPAAAMLYASELHSYRDLPLRYADFGRLHRFERSGVTHGLTRVRTFSQDDAHIFCAPEQVESEITWFIEMVQETYTLFGFDDVRVALSLRPEDRIGSDELWDEAEAALAAALDARGMEYEPFPGEALSTAPRSTSSSPTPSGANGSSAPCNSTTTCLSGSTWSSSTPRACAAAPSSSTARCSAASSASSASPSSTSAAPSPRGSPPCKPRLSPSPTATSSTRRRCGTSSRPPASAFTSTTAASG